MRGGGTGGREKKESRVIWKPQGENSRFKKVWRELSSPEDEKKKKEVKSKAKLTTGGKRKDVGS